MAVRTRDELLGSLKTLLEGNTSDAALSILEDVTDTYDSLHKDSGEDWKTKYEENDKSWREKYAARFYGGGSSQHTPESQPPTSTEPTTQTESTEPTTPSPEDVTFDDLFS